MRILILVPFENKVKNKGIYELNHIKLLMKYLCMVVTLIFHNYDNFCIEVIVSWPSNN